MRLFFVTEKFPPVPCGIGDQVFRIAEVLARRGHRVHVYTSKIEESPKQHEEPRPGIRVHRLGARWDQDELGGLAELAGDLGADVIHLQYHAFSYQKQPAVWLLPWVLRRHPLARSIRRVVTLHELAGPPLAGWPPLPRRLWLLPLCRFSDAVVVSNERDDLLLGRIPGLRRKRALIPPASSIPVAPMEGFDRRLFRARWGVPENAFLLVRFGFVHNFETSAFPTLLQSLREVKGRGVPAHLLLVGGEESADRKKLDAAIARLQLTDSVTLTGQLDEETVSRCLAVSDAAVQLYPEGACEKRSSLQAVLLHSLPVISTLGPGVPALFRNGENFYGVPLRDVSALSRAVEALYQNEPLRQRLASGAAEAAHHFSWEASAEKLEALYASLLPCAS